MEGFCGEPLWEPIDPGNWNRTTTIDFTECFKQTVLIYAPCGFLWLSLIYGYFQAKNSSNRPIQWSFLNVSKLLLCFLLIVSSVVELSLAIYDAFTVDFIYPVKYATPLIRASTYCLALVLVLAHRRKGIHTAGILFLFWTLLSVYAILSYRLIFVYYWSGRDEGNFRPHVESVPSYIFKSIEFPLILSQLFLAFFADVRPQFIWPGKEVSNICPKELASFPNQMIFEWVTPIIRLGYKRPLRIADCWTLDRLYTTDYILTQFNRRWEKRPKDDRSRMARLRRNVAFVTFRVLWPLFSFCFILKIVQTVLMFSSPIVLDWLIYFMSSDDPNWKGYFYSFLLFFISFMESIFENQYEFFLGMLQMKVKTCLMSTVYKKALVLSTDGRKDFSTGQIINMMSVDVQAIVDYISMINVVWSSPIQLFVCFYLVWQQLGIATLAGAATLVLLVPINGYCTKQMRKYQSLLMKEKDKRSKLVDEILNGIKIIKLYTWEESFKEKITKIRNKEISCLNRSAYYIVGIAMAFSCASFLVSLALFATYLLIDPANVLTANKAFVTLSLLNLLRVPFGLLPIAVMFGAIASVSLKRITKYLNADELEEKDELVESYNSEPMEEKPKKSNRNAVTIRDGTFSWNKTGGACLKNIELKVGKNSLIAVVGKVGSGKSSLANALIGEMRKNSGTIQVNGSIAYVPQTSWILNNSFRENIVFMNPFDQELYDKVVKICALDDDLKVFANGDLTEIGEKGINLSGGQKQRVSLARACYSNSDIFVLDDPLSAVDSHVGKFIFDKVIGPSGYLKNKTRILITHKIPLLKNVDRIIVLKDGQISEQGSYDELIEAKGEFSEILNTYINEEAKKEKEESLEQSISEKRAVEESLKRSLKRELSVKQADNDKGRLIAEEKQEVGSVKLSVYIDFFKSMGIWFIFLTLLMFILASAFNIATNLWLTAWSEDANDPTKNNDTALRNKRIGAYAGYGLTEATFALVATTLLNLGMVKASKYLHAGMLNNVLRAPMRFFDTTPMGRVLNRFSKDLDTVDMSLRFTFRFMINQFFRTIVSIVILCIETPIFLVVSVPIGLCYVYIQKLYIATSRQLKRLESTTRSPIYSHFSETVQGVSSVRAYRLTEKFIKECHRRIDLNNSCFYPSVAATRWLTVRLGFLGFIVVLLSGIFAVLYRDTLSPSLAGLAISFSLSFTVLLNNLIKAFSDVETNVVAVERCFEYTKLETEAPAKSEYRPAPGWPSRGVVKFKNYGTRYRQDLSPVLKNLTFETKENEKVGICGRTGAGKSTLTLAMFRLLEPTEGTIEIDGVDIRSLGLDDLRSNLTIIPQDPFLYSDTLRMNLDPFNKHTDDELWKALELASLKEFVQESPEGLHKIVEEGGSNLSVGQRQLVCLARALLRRTKVLMLDEATAACDFETDEVIQKTIRSAFADNTILTIAHRLNTIIDYDKVIVLENGELREFDSPKKLLENKNSIFYSMAKESGLV